MAGPSGGEIALCGTRSTSQCAPMPVVGELITLQRELSDPRRELAELRKEHAKASSDREQYRALYMQMMDDG